MKTEYKGHVIMVSSTNMWNSSRRTKNPKQVWSASVDYHPCIDGSGSRKDAIESAKRLIDLRGSKKENA